MIFHGQNAAADLFVFPHCYFVTSIHFSGNIFSGFGSNNNWPSVASCGFKNESSKDGGAKVTALIDLV